MKKIFFFILLMLAVCGTTMIAAQKHIKAPMKVERIDSSANAADTTYAPSYSDATDTASADNDDEGIADVSSNPSLHFQEVSDMIVPIIAIVGGFAVPLLIIFFIFYFRYKNRKAKYQLAEKALASGKPLPDGLFTESDSSSVSHSAATPNYYTADRDKGIRNTFIGIGLFIFLWAITKSFGVGCIGLLVMFYGLGLWLVSQKHKEDVQQNGYFKPNDNGYYTGTSQHVNHTEQPKSATENSEPKVEPINTPPAPAGTSTPDPIQAPKVESTETPKTEPTEVPESEKDNNTTEDNIER